MVQKMDENWKCPHHTGIDHASAEHFRWLREAGQSVDVIFSPSTTDFPWAWEEHGWLENGNVCRPIWEVRIPILKGWFTGRVDAAGLLSPKRQQSFATLM